MSFFFLDLTLFLPPIGAFEIDQSNLEKEDAPPSVLPPSLSEVLISENYRQYIDSDGNLIPGREEEYRVFVWFVKNILKSRHSRKESDVVGQVKLD